MKDIMNAPSVTKPQIEALHAKLIYRFSQPEGTTSTYCFAFLPGTDGRMFSVSQGFSACVSPANFSDAIGKQQSKADASHKAWDKLWELEGYLLFKELENGN